jgi:hypothetical protein
VAYSGLRFRLDRQLSRGRLTAAAVLVALYPAVREISALTALAAVTAVCVGLIAYEAIRYREVRSQLRASRAAA